MFYQTVRKWKKKYALILEYPSLVQWTVFIYVYIHINYQTVYMYACTTCEGMYYQPLYSFTVLFLSLISFRRINDRLKSRFKFKPSAARRRALASSHRATDYLI